MDDRHVEAEPYEEIVDRAEMFSMPSGSTSASPVSVDGSLPPAQSHSQGPSTSVYNANLMTSVMRPDQRYELALVPQVPHLQTEHVGSGSHTCKSMISNVLQENQVFWMQFKEILW